MNSLEKIDLPELPPGWHFSRETNYYFVVLGDGESRCSVFCVDRVRTVEDKTRVYRIESGVLDKATYSQPFEDFTGYASMQEALDAAAILLWCRHQEFEQQVKGFVYE